MTEKTLNLRLAETAGLLRAGARIKGPEGMSALCDLLNEAERELRRLRAVRPNERSANRVERTLGTVLAVVVAWLMAIAIAH